MPVTDCIEVGGPEVRSVVLGGPELVLIAGPCSLESASVVRSAAEQIAAVVEPLGVPWVFKGSFDKANRTRGNSWRGPGMRQGLEWLARVREEHRVPVTTDVHTVEQVAPVSRVVDLLQVPAFLCRQTDLLRACGASGCPVHVKRGQFLAPGALEGIVEKVGRPVLLTERGSSFGHGDLVFDPRMLVWMRQTGMPVCFDATHSVQQPGGQGTGGLRAMVGPLARAAVGVGVDALFVEVHPDPNRARSDGASQLTPRQLQALLESVLPLHAARRSFPPSPAAIG